MYSDNGLNLVGGELELQKLIMQWNQGHISKHMSSNGIQWTFNPPYASHRGGVWERMIRTTRKLLKALGNQQLITDEQLLAFMTEAERIINERPITPCSNDPKDPLALTPNMLLLMKTDTCTFIPQGVFDKKDTYS